MMGRLAIFPERASLACRPQAHATRLCEAGLHLLWRADAMQAMTNSGDLDGTAVSDPAPRSFIAIEFTP